MDATIILAIILLSGLLSFWQEYRASQRRRGAAGQRAVTVEVMRDGQRVFVPTDDVVPGDIIYLDTGDLVPADCLLLEAREPLLDEATLTGESFPVGQGAGGRQSGRSAQPTNQLPVSRYARRARRRHRRRRPDR